MPLASWSEVAEVVLMQPPGEDIHLLRGALPSPRSAGFGRSFGLPKRGCLLQYRRATGDGGCVHVRQYKHHFEVHYDRVDPRRRPFAHWWVDIKGGPFSMTGTLVALATAIVLRLR